MDSVHMEGEELEVLAYRGGLGDVLLRVIAVLGHLASHRDQAWPSYVTLVEGNINETRKRLNNFNHFSQMLSETY